MALNFMVGARLIQAVQAIIPRWTGRDQSHLIALADAAAGAGYDAAFAHIEPLEDFRTDLSSSIGASLVGTTTLLGGGPDTADLQEVLDDMRADINSIGGGGGGFALDTAVVHDTGDEDVGGIKTFLSDPIVHKANASYVVTDGGFARAPQGGLTCFGTNDVGLYATNASSTIRWRPNGRASTTGEMILNSAGTLTINGIEMGFRNLPRVTSFTSDAAGKMLATAAGITIDTGPAAGTFYSIYNDSAVSITITQGAGMTLRLAGTTNTGSRNLAARGLMSIWFNSSSEAVCSGVGLT
jgi:hypothetical protein